MEELDSYNAMDYLEEQIESDRYEREKEEEEERMDRFSEEAED